MAKPNSQTSEITSIQPPQSLEAEQAVLGAVLKNTEAANRVVDILRDPLDFYAPRHQMIYQAVLDLFESNEPIDITTVLGLLQQRGQLDKIGGRVFLVELVEAVASTANVAQHAKIVMERGLLRRLIATSNDIVTNCYSQEQPVEELLDKAEQEIFRLSESRLRQGFMAVRPLITSTMKSIEDMQLSDGGLTGLKTGFHELDELTLGLHKGDLIVIAGRPSMGKTALAMNIAENLATREKDPKTVGMFSIEMSKEALVLRMLCGRARLNQQKVRSGKLNDSDWEKLPRAGHGLSNSKIFIDDSPSLSPLDIRAKARRLKAQYGLDLLIIDYIQLMHSSLKVENRQQEISLITRSIKALAKELEIPIIALSQLSRAVEMRSTKDKRPQLADLRESGAIEQDADLVLMLYREEFYLSREERTDPANDAKIGRAEVIIAKQRNGPTGSIDLTFIGEFARFENLSPRDHSLPPGVEPVHDEGGDMPF